MEYIRFRDAFAKRRTPKSQWEPVDEIPEDALAELVATENRDRYVANHGEEPPKQYAPCNERCTAAFHAAELLTEILTEDQPVVETSRASRSKSEESGE